MATYDDVKSAIEKNLPMEVGSALRARLMQADSDLETLNATRRLLAETEAKLKRANDLLATHDEVTSRLKKLDEREKEIWLKARDQSLIDMREAHARERVHDMKELVLAVFANNHFKYTVNDGGTIPMNYPGGGFGSQGFSRTTVGEGTGAPPPPPTDVPHP